MDLRVISIGTLAVNPLWGEKQPTRTGHATTSLVRIGERAILVDPGLPAPALKARLAERTGLEPAAITDVFLTSFTPEHWRGIELFRGASWWVAEAERESVGVVLAGELRRAMDSGELELARALERDVAILHACQPAPDELAPGVSLFPMPGVTPGLGGLLLAESLRTTLICGDAVATVEHLEQGRVLDRAADLDRARESFAEAIEIADLLVLGRDNLTPNQTKRPF